MEDIEVTFSQERVTKRWKVNFQHGWALRHWMRLELGLGEDGIAIEGTGHGALIKGRETRATS